MSQETGGPTATPSEVMSSIVLSEQQSAALQAQASPADLAQATETTFRDRCGMCRAAGTAACHLTVELTRGPSDTLTIWASCQDCGDAQTPLQAAAALARTAGAVANRQPQQSSLPRSAEALVSMQRVLARANAIPVLDSALAERSTWVVRDVDEATRRAVKCYAVWRGIPIARALRELMEVAATTDGNDAPANE